MRERLPWLGYGRPTHCILSFFECCCPCEPTSLSILTLVLAWSSRLSLYLPVLLYSNNDSPSKVSKVWHPYPLLTPVVLFTLAHICGLGLCPVSELVCDLLPRRLFHGSPKAHGQNLKIILVTIIRKIHSLHSSLLISQTTRVVFKINSSYIFFKTTIWQFWNYFISVFIYSKVLWINKLLFWRMESTQVVFIQSWNYFLCLIKNTICTSITFEWLDGPWPDIKALFHVLS